MFSGLINSINTNQTAETETQFMEDDGGIHQRAGREFLRRFFLDAGGGGG